MKRTLLSAAIVATAVLTIGWQPTEYPAPLDLTGRKITVRLYRNHKINRTTYENVVAIIDGRTVRPKVEDANDATLFSIRREDQGDELLKKVLEEGSYGWWWKEDGPQYLLPVSSAEVSGRKVTVRLYNNPDEEPLAFNEHSIKVEGRVLNLSFADANESAFVAIFGYDQKDVVIKKLLANALFAWTYQENLKFSLPVKPAGENGQQCWTVLDALGNHMPNACVKALLTKEGRELTIGRATADSEGQFRTSFALPKAGIFWPSQRGPVRARLRFVISHPAYGTAVVEPYPGVRRDWLYVPLAESGSEADQRSIWGVVVDQYDKPIEGAFVQADGVVAVGAKGVPGVSGQEHGVLTDEDGRFRTYVPIAEHVDEIGTLIPPKAKYSVRIEPPADQNLVAFRGRIPNGQHSKITLEYMGCFRTFVFEDENGPITDPKQLENIEVIIRRQGWGNDIWLRYEKWKDGGKFPLGRYEAKSHRYIFQPLEVKADSGEQLVFRLPPARTYYGRVVHGITGEPMSEVSVRISTEDLVITDQDGGFEITVSPKAAVNLIYVSKENYLKVRVLKSWIKQDRTGRYQLPEVRLFPAATVIVEPVGAKHPVFPTLFFRPQWFLAGKDNPPWVKDLLDGFGEHPQEGIYRDFGIGGRKGNSFPAPAGVALRINLRVLGDIEWAPVTIADGITLEEGEVRNLGRIEIVDPFKVFVEVVNATGTPVEGVPVTVCGDWDPAVSSSDEEGVAIFDFVGPCKGEFIVEYKPENYPDAPKLREAIPFEVRGPQDANTVHTIRLSDEILQKLLKQASLDYD